MKRVLPLLLAALLLIGCAGSSQAAAYTSISQEAAKEMMLADYGHVIVDVRRLDEYASGHIPGAICVPNESIADTQPEKLPDPDQVIMVYCRSGRRSKEASQKLADIGYTQVYEFGGILDWDGPVITDASSATERGLDAFMAGDGRQAEALLTQAWKEDGDAHALTLLGDLYAAGKLDHVPNYEQAKVFYERAGKAGDTEAFFKIAELYREGKLVAGSPCTDDLEALGKQAALPYYQAVLDAADAPEDLREKAEQALEALR